MELVGVPLVGGRVVPRSIRFDAGRKRLYASCGDGFIAVEIDSSPGNPYGNPKNAHYVLTQHLIDQPGHPTRDYFRGK